MSTKNAALAQLDRVFGYEPKGQGFESLTLRQIKRIDASVSILFILDELKRDSNTEGDTAVKKRVRWTLFRREREGPPRARADMQWLYPLR